RPARPGRQRQRFVDPAHVPWKPEADDAPRPAPDVPLETEPVQGRLLDEGGVARAHPDPDGVVPDVQQWRNLHPGDVVPRLALSVQGRAPPSPTTRLPAS